jgi:putative oxidoreductase
VGTPALAAGILVRPLSLYFAAQLAMGILLVHRPEGWFVVGLGRNGMEHSVLLIAVFLALAWASDSRGERAS